MTSSVLIGSVEMAGYVSAISDGFLQNGWESYVFLKKTHRYDYKVPTSKDFFLSALTKLMRLLERPRDQKKWWHSILLSPTKKLTTVVLVIWALLRIKHIILVFNESFFKSGFDLVLFKFFRKNVMMVHLGSDTRPPYLSGKWLLKYNFDISDTLVRDTEKALAKKARKVARYDKWVTYTVDSPMAGHLHTKPFINWFSLGFPIVSKSFGIESQYEKSKVVTIVHAPSHKGIKGTELIESVVQELKSEGYNFEYVQLANVPNHEVRSFLAKADIVVDQLWSDTPLAGLACEAASAGCCVIVGGEEWSYFEESLVPIPPSLRVHSSTLKKSLIKCLEEPKFRQRVAKDLQSFARNEWSSKAVAAKYISLFESGNLVGGWVDPSDCIFFGGCGAPKHYFKAIMKRMGANQVGRPNKPS